MSTALLVVTVLLLSLTGEVDAQQGSGGGSGSGRRHVPGVGRVPDRSDARTEERTTQFVLRGPKQRIQEIAARHGLKIVDRIDQLGRDVFLVSGPENILNLGSSFDPGAPLVQSMLQSVQADPEVAHFEPNALVVTPEVPDGVQLNNSTIEILDALTDRTLVPYYGMQAWSGYVNQPATVAVRLGDTRTSGVTGAGIVAVIDTGVDPNHPLLQAALVPGYDFTTDTAGIPSEWDGINNSTIEILDNSTIEILDSRVAPVRLNASTVALLDPAAPLDPSTLPPAFGHGTLVAGVIRLVAPTAKIMPLKAFHADGTSNTFDIVRAVYWAVDHGARVINMSFSATALSPELGRAINYATDRGVICVASTGNLGQETIVYPGGQRNVVGVASTTSAASPARSAFSNYGDGLVSVAAPGESIITAYPGGGYAGAWGTSFSAPIVAGAAALLLQIDPELDYQKASALLNKALRMTPGMGAGRVNLFDAVRSLPDRVAPVVSMVTPATGGTVFGTVLVSANASDNLTVSGVKFLLDEQQVGPEDTAAPYEFQWSTSAASNGTHLLTAVARDAAGNLTTTTTSVTVFNDTTPPTVALTSPGAEAMVTGTTAISATVTDDGTIAAVQFKLDGVALGAEDTAAPYELAWNTVTAVEGAHALTAVARDAAGNEAASPSIVVNVARDNTAPAVAITSPAPATTVGGTVTVSATASDDRGVVQVQFLLDGVPLGAPDAVAPYDVAWATGAAANGTHALTAVARDTAGNEATSAVVGVTVTNDNSAPTIVIMNPTAAATVGDNVTVTAVASDDVGVTSVQFLLDGTPLGAADTAAPYDTVWATLDTVNGAHTLTALARDGAGKETTAAAVNVTVTNDRSAPTVSITGPTDATTVGGTVTVSATASDDVGVVSIQFMLDGATLGPNLSTAPYTTPWLTTSAANGTHTLTAIARDAAGKTTNSTAITVTVLNDLAAPAIALTSPTAGSMLSGTVMLSASASDDIAVTSVQFLIDGVSIANLTAAPYDFAWASTAAANGAHTLSAVARDAAGHEAVTTINVVVMNDLAPPTVAFAGPANGSTVSGTVTVSATATDDVGVSMVRFLLDGAALGGADDAPPYQVPWPTATGTANGPHTLTAIARDSAGRETTATINVVVANDAAAPTVSVTSPAADTTVSGAVTLTATASDDIGVTSVQFMVDGAALGAADTTAPYEATWSTAGTGNGPHTLTAVAHDAVGNQTTATTISVTVLNDVTAPTVSLTSPAANATLAGAITVAAIASDDIGVTSVQFLLDGAPLGALDTGAPYEAAWATTSAANGAHTLTAVARDAAGRETTTPALNVTVSNDAAAPSVAISNPVTGSTVAGAVTITANASDDVGVTSVQFLVDGAALGAADTVAPFEANWATIATANGVHLLTAVARDAVGNETTASTISVTVLNDVGAPAVSVTSPAANATVGGSVVVTASASDDIGVTSVQFLLDGAPLGAIDSGAPYEAVWPTNGTANGAHTITAVARDAAGNQTTATAVAVTVFNDITAPSVNVTSPAAAATVGGTVTVTASAADDVAVTSVQFLLDGAALGAADTAAPYEATWTTTASANGAHTLTAVARDAAGHEATATAITATVFNDLVAPTVAVTTPSATATVGGVVTMTASASDNVAVSSVQFMLNGAPLGAADTAAPYETAWTTTSTGNGPQTVSAVALDAAGNQASAAPITVTVLNDLTAPTVSMTNPVNGQTITGMLTVSATATDDVGVTNVQFFLDGAPLGTPDTAAPFDATWLSASTPNGSHSLAAVARDAAGRETTTAPITVTVVNDSAAPTVSITAPAATATVSGAVTVTANASDDVGVTTVQFMLDGAPLGPADTAAPYDAAWATAAAANGAHTLTAVARDAAGAATTSTAVVVTVLNDAAAPTVSVASPAAAATVSGAVTITANASDDIGVTSVQFLLDGAPLGAADTVAPYEVAWSTTTATNGTHTLAAAARDAAGHESISASVSISVVNDISAPTVTLTNPVANSTVAGSVTVSATAADDIGVVSVQFLLDGEPLGAVDNEAPYQTDWVTTTAVNGIHTLSVIARDAANNATTISATVTVANEPPGAAANVEAVSQ